MMSTCLSLPRMTLLYTAELQRISSRESHCLLQITQLLQNRCSPSVIWQTSNQSQPFYRSALSSTRPFVSDTDWWLLVALSRARQKSLIFWKEQWLQSQTILTLITELLIFSSIPSQSCKINSMASSMQTLVNGVMVCWLSQLETVQKALHPIGNGSSLMDLLTLFGLRTWTLC